MGVLKSIHTMAFRDVNLNRLKEMKRSMLKTKKAHIAISYKID